MIGLPRSSVLHSHTLIKRERKTLRAVSFQWRGNVRVTYICPLRLVAYIRPSANLDPSSKRHTLSTVVSQPDISGVDRGFSLERQPWTINWIHIMSLALNEVCEAQMRFTGRLRTCVSSSYKFDSSSTSILLCNTSNCFVEFANGLAESTEGYGSSSGVDVAMDDYYQTRPNVQPITTSCLCIGSL